MMTAGEQKGHTEVACSSSRCRRCVTGKDKACWGKGRPPGWACACREELSRGTAAAAVGRRLQGPRAACCKGVEFWAGDQLARSTIMMAKHSQIGGSALPTTPHTPPLSSTPAWSEQGLLAQATLWTAAAW